ncbi:MAG: alpha/beta fold hydrolase [Methylomarinum sp.]|nr:alpha/beta fold hydrolase [Methylomarinum sp.]
MKLFIRRLPLCLLFLMFLNGCAHHQTVDRLYPLWGKDIILTSDDNRSRHLQIKQPEQSGFAEACILIVHGMNEYIGRYAEIAHYFGDRYIVAGIDLTAHGLSNPVFATAQKVLKTGATKQDISDAFLEQAQLRDLQPMRDDLEQALHYLIHHCDQHSDNTTLPVFILSHSLGSLVSASYLLQTENNKFKDRISGIIFAGPAFSVTQIPGWRGWLQNPFVRFSYHTHQHFLNPHDEALPLMLFNQLLALVTVPIQDGIIELLSLPGLRQLFSPSTPDWVVNYLSNWDEERARHKNDPYIIRRSILRYVLTVEKEVIQFRSNMTQFNTPYLLIYSEHDPITPAWGNTDFAAATRQNHPANETMMLAGESHHEQLFSTPELRQQIFKKIRLWIASRVSED